MSPRDTRVPREPMWPAAVRLTGDPHADTIALDEWGKKFQDEMGDYLRKLYIELVYGVVEDEETGDVEIGSDLTLPGTLTAGTVTDGTFSVTGGAVTGASGNVSMWTNDVPYALETHAHAGTDITSGTISTDRYSAYADLGAESKIGTGATQVAQGDHLHDDRYYTETESTTLFASTGGTETVTGAWGFDLDPLAPFTVSAGSAVVTNLDAEKVDGLHASDFAGGSHAHAAADITSGTLGTDRFSAYTDLGAELKIGAGAAQVAAGNHTHTGVDADTLDTHDSTYFAVASHTHDDRYFTETELGAGQLNTLYYTEGEVDGFAVKLSGNQSVAGIKTFSSFPLTPSLAPTTNYQAANKKYVDDSVGGGGQTIGGWCKYNQNTPAILDSYNVSGVSDNAAGNFTISWDVDFANAHYCVAGIVEVESTTENRTLCIYNGGQAAGTLNICTFVAGSGAAIDLPGVHVMAIGDQ